MKMTAIPVSIVSLSIVFQSPFNDDTLEGQEVPQLIYQATISKANLHFQPETIKSRLTGSGPHSLKKPCYSLNFPSSYRPKLTEIRRLVCMPSRIQPGVLGVFLQKSSTFFLTEGSWAFATSRNGREPAKGSFK